MGQVEPKLWASSVAGRVGKNIQRARKIVDMSAQDLSNACEANGYPIPRSTIANIESGRKETVSLQELLVIAEVVGAPPLALIYWPFDAADDVMVTAKTRRLSVDASEAFAFDTGSSIGKLHEQCLSVRGLEMVAQHVLWTASKVHARQFSDAPERTIQGLGIESMLEDDDLDAERIRQEVEGYQRAAYSSITKAYKGRASLKASGVELWPIPKNLASTYEQVRADSGE